ncbi:hypothetical protein HAX54_039443, partial [Datura stramonium]|nr:hypothetical protein [Datura stramonium]
MKGATEDAIAIAFVFPQAQSLSMSYSSSNVIMLTPRFPWFAKWHSSVSCSRIPKISTRYFHQNFKGLGREVFLQLAARIPVVLNLSNNLAKGLVHGQGIGFCVCLVLGMDYSAAERYTLRIGIYRECATIWGLLGYHQDDFMLNRQGCPVSADLGKCSEKCFEDGNREVVRK